MPNSRGGKFFLNLGFLIVSCLCALILAEFYARSFLNINYFTFDGVSPVFDQELKIQYKVLDKRIGFRPGPEWSGDQGRYGFQNGKEYEGADTAGSKKIFLLGDSVIQSRFLEQALKQVLQGTQFEIYNAGIGGYNTIQEAYYLEHYINITPDILVLGFCLNDFSPPFWIVSDKDKERNFAQSLFEPVGYVNVFLFRHSALYRFLKLKTLRLDTVVWTRQRVLNNESNVRDALVRMAEYCRKNKADFLIIIYPHLLDYSDGDYLTEAHAAILRLANELNIRFIDLHGPIKKSDYALLKVKPDDVTHLNPKGHRLAAHALVKKFYPVFGLKEKEAEALIKRDHGKATSSYH